jgi:hypothetical protein
MPRFRRFGVAIAVTAVSSLGLASPAIADGGDLNGYWQFHSAYPTYEQCDNAGDSFVPEVADGWACSLKIPVVSHGTPPGTEGWKLYLVFAS